MDIDGACKTIRSWQDLLDPSATRRSVPGGLPEAVEVLRAYLEEVDGNGKEIVDLVLPDRVLTSPEGLRWVMPYVYRAEAIRAARVRIQR